MSEVEIAAELAGPVAHVEEASDDAATDFLLDALKAGAAAEEFFESERFAVADDVIVG